MKGIDFLKITVISMALLLFCGCAEKQTQSKVVRKIVSKYENGAPKEIAYHSKGALIAKETLDESGKIIAVTGRVPSKVDECCDNKDVVRWAGTLKDKKREGVCKHYTAKGEVEFEGSYKNDKLHGICKYYDSSGKSVLEGAYSNGKREGAFKYYENGMLKSEENYNNDKRHGKCTYYNSKGETEQVHIYENDCLMKKGKEVK